MENAERDQLTEMDLQMDEVVRLQFNETAKWSKFISIVMFVGCGLLLIVGLVGGAALFTIFKSVGARYGFLDEFSGAIIIMIIVAVVAVLALVYYFLFNFAQKIKAALLTDNVAELNAGLKSLKTFFIITTIFAIISLLNSIWQMFR